MPHGPVGIIAHTTKPGAPAVLSALLGEFSRHGVTPLLDPATARLVGRDSPAALNTLCSGCGLILVLGGDGTLLRVIHELGMTAPPILGINIGSLGFLTSAHSNDLAETVSRIVRGDYRLSPRSLLDVVVERRSDEGHFNEEPPVAGLNDCVLSRGTSPNLVRLRVEVDDGFLTDYSADGVIIATPTGSTAYSLSAGGPIVAPEAGLFALTPICPHVLTNRSVILPDHSTIRITVAPGSGPAVLCSVDGRPPTGLARGDRIRIARASHKVTLAHLPGSSFFEVLRDKLRWTGSSL